MTIVTLVAAFLLFVGRVAFFAVVLAACLSVLGWWSP